jgi:acetyl-CoA acetyltransferase
MTQTHHAAVVGFTENRAQKMSADPGRTSLELAAELAVRALADAGLTLKEVDGLSVGGIHQSAMFVPSTVAEYLGVEARFADVVDLGGATPAGMVWRAALAIEKGLAEVVLCLTPGLPRPRAPDGANPNPFGASSYLPGSPQAEFDIPYGHLGQNALYAMVAQRYGFEFGYDERAMARLVVQQRTNACATPEAFFHGKPLTEEQVQASRKIARPLRMLEIVMPVMGGSALVLASPAVAKRCRHRPVWLRGYGEAVHYKSPQYAADLLDPPIRDAAARAFAMANLTPAQMDVAQIYDCYTITVVLALEAAGFCKRGEGMAFLRQHDLTWRGDFPLNTNGGQLGFGQAGFAGGMCHVTEAVRQLSGRAGERQVQNCNRAFVMGNGGIMSEQIALIMEGD